MASFTGGVMGILGGVAGGMKDPGQSTRGSNDVTTSLQSYAALNRGASPLEGLATQNQVDIFKQLQNLTSMGPGASDVMSGYAANQGLAQLLQSMAAGGGLPTSAQTNQAQSYAQSIFAPQQTMLNQQFEQENIQNQRLAARMGRPGTDPVLQAKLAKAQGQQQQLLSSQQTAFGAQTAMQLPQMQLQLANQLAQVRGGLASQALQNRTSLLSMGQSLAQAERNYRLSAANKHEATAQDSYTVGSPRQALLGGIAGYGAGAQAEGSMMQGYGSLMGSMGGGMMG